MNKNILKKCLDELEKVEFSKDYVRGMLETLYEMDSPSISVTTGTSFIKSSPTLYVEGTKTNNEIITEEIPEHLKLGPIGTITR